MRRHVQDTSTEMVWKGRLHIGDEPGMYGDAEYSGLAVELPLILTDYAGGGTPAEVTFDLTAEDASSFGAPYPEHKLTVSALTQVAGSNPPVWGKKIIVEAVLDADTVSIQARIEPSVRHVTVRVAADVTVSPRFYDDFVLTGLSLRSSTHYADFGFRA